MANKIIQPLAPVVGVVGGQTATLDVPIGPRYHVIWLVGDVVHASIVPTLAKVFDGLITVKLNGKPVRSHTAAELDALNTLNGAGFAATAITGTTYQRIWYLPIFLAEPWRKSYSATEAMAWPTSWPGNKKLGTFQIEIAVPSNSGYTINSITAYAEQDNMLGSVDNAGNPVMLISKWNRLTVPYAGNSGKNYITTLPRREILQQISIITNTPAVIADLMVKVDGLIIRDATKDVNDRTLIAREMNASGLSALRYDVVFDYDDLPSSALPMQYGGATVQDFQVIPNIGSGASETKVMTVLYLVYGRPD